MNNVFTPGNLRNLVMERVDGSTRPRSDFETSEIVLEARDVISGHL